jgi:16S rRNA (guanine1207-N2)-methyltransferase
MSNLDLETLFYPIQSGAIETAGKRAVFWHAKYHPLIDTMNVDCVSYWAQDAAGLSGKLLPEHEIEPESYDIALVRVPKNMVEAEYALASALKSLARDGILIAAAGNKAGGGRLVKLFEGFGLKGVQSDARNKCRLVWVVVKRFHEQAVAAAIKAGGVQNVQNHPYLTQPGVFGWDKVDKGSVLLAAQFSDQLVGKGADFGCGYGYLALHVQGAEALYAIDADSRAVDLCAKNVQCVIPVWSDILAGDQLPAGLDFIVMNPPFHEGKHVDTDIGAAFIQQAARHLKKGGVLWMVANVGLPYERVLGCEFSSVERKAQANGFKVLRAVK